MPGDVPGPSRDEVVLVLAPIGRDTPLTCGILTDRAGLACEACADITDMCARINSGAGAIILAEEALDPVSSRRLMDALGAQLPWSDVPVIVLINSADNVIHGPQLSLLRERGNVTVLERPLRIVTLVTAVQSALRARRRQYEVRDLLMQTRAAVRQRDQFLAMLGHELRNPLATITNAMTVIDAAAPAHNELESEQRDIIRRQTNHLARLVDDLLDVSRITSGKVQLQRRPVDLCQLAQKTVRVIEAAARDHGHEIKVDVGCGESVIVDADSVRIEQIINNLLTNAIKYTPDGGRIEVSISRQNKNAILTVRDNGIGMTPDLLPRAFDLFTQADRALDRSQGGLGIGLTLVRSLVEMHGGKVQARSDGPGHGSSFTVTLPLSSRRPETRTSMHPVPPPGAGRHILVVEDNHDARRALQRLLQIWGHRVDVAEDGNTGIHLAVTTRPQIAFVDVGLPGVDGYEVARRVRAELGSDIRLIALTGYGQPEDRDRALASGFDLHLVKPVDRDRLLRAMEGAASFQSTSSRG